MKHAVHAIDLQRRVRLQGVKAMLFHRDITVEAGLIGPLAGLYSADRCERGTCGFT